MTPVRLFGNSLCALAVLACTGARSQSVAPGSRSVAVTFDDLPATRAGSLPDVERLTARLLSQIRSLAMPAIGFVNESKLAVPGEEAARADLLGAWLDAGLDLGNHTYSHAWLFEVPLETFQAEVLRGERVIRQLLAKRGRVPRYFRHPRLNTGPDRATKQRFERFLADHGYTVAPVTFDNDEFLYAAAYDRARARGNSAFLRRLAGDYIRYMRETVVFYEQLSLVTLGREPAQVLLLHANALNADHLPALAAMLRERGYRFVSLDSALADPAYRQRDDYVGRQSPSWLVRWALTRGARVADPPMVPAWVSEAAR